MYISIKGYRCLLLGPDILKVYLSLFIFLLFMSDYLKQDTRNENVFVLSLMSGETTPIYFSTYMSKIFVNKVLKHCRSN